MDKSRIKGNELPSPQEQPFVYVVDHTEPCGAYCRGADRFTDEDEAREAVSLCISDIRQDPGQFDPGMYMFYVRECTELDDGLLERGKVVYQAGVRI